MSRLTRRYTLGDNVIIENQEPNKHLLTQDNREVQQIGYVYLAFFLHKIQ